ncbi:32181_t:CDS:2, partial [Racocetra persica]
PSVVPVPKVLPKSRQPRPTITEVFDAYYDESAEEPLESIVFGSKEEERETELEALLQKLIAKCEAVAQKWAPKKEKGKKWKSRKRKIGGAKETYLVGPYCEEVGVKEVKEKKEIEVEKEAAGVEKDEEKEVEVKREEKEKTKEEKKEKYEENVPARIGKIVEDVEKLTKKSKDLDYTCESWIKKVEGFRSRVRWSRGAKKPTKNKPAEAEEDTTNISECYRNKGG